MSDEVVVALIGAIVSIVGSYSLVNYRLKKLEEKVDKHNGFADKIAQTTTDIALIKKDIQYIKEALEK